MSKKMSVLIAVLFLVSAFSSIVLGVCTDPSCYGDPAETPQLDIVDCWVQVNDRYIYADRTVYLSFERGEDIDLSVEFVSKQDAENVQVQALILGYEHGDRAPEDISDISPTFDVEANRSYYQELSLRLPDDLEPGDLKIRVIVSDRSASSFIRDYNLDIEAQRHNVMIKKMVLDPSNEVVAGRGLLAKVYVKNMGDKDEDGITITVEIPALDLEATEFIDELEAGDSTKPEDDLFMRIPPCTKPGTYVVRATVEYDDGYETVSKETTIDILADESCEASNGGTTPKEDKTIITVPGKQDIVVGTTGAVYPVMITNTGAVSKSYVITVTGVDAWGTYRIDPSTVAIVAPGSTVTTYVYVSANNDAQDGEKIFVVKVESATETKEVPLTANVVKGQAPSGDDNWANVKKMLEVGLVALVVVLVVLGLIIGFGKLKGGKEEEPEEITGQTYY